jgi:hypothetical protein
LFVVGAAKAGTTSLHAYLDAHAGVHMSDPKEPHFFARAINPSVRTKSWDTYAEAFRGATENAILGDASTSYLWDPAGAELIHEALPDSRIVVLLRDPVARAISHYTMDVLNGRQRRSFDDALRADAAIPERIWGVKSHLYIDLGMYAAQVRRYLETFGRDRVLVIESATLRKSRRAALTQIARFLGIDPSGFDEARLDAEYNLTAMPRSIQLNYLATRRRVRRVLRSFPQASARRSGAASVACHVQAAPVTVLPMPSPGTADIRAQGTRRRPDREIAQRRARHWIRLGRGGVEVTAPGTGVMASRWSGGTSASVGTPSTSSTSDGSRSR